MTDEVSRHAAYVALVDTVQRVTRHSAYIALTQPYMGVASHTAYVVLVDAPAPVGGMRRSQPLMGV